nr:hypothetical protein GCM10020063_063350 [Dactylosporangium thailandense]
MLRRPHEVAGHIAGEQGPQPVGLGDAGGEQQLGPLVPLPSRQRAHVTVDPAVLGRDEEGGDGGLVPRQLAGAQLGEGRHRRRELLLGRRRGRGPEPVQQQRHAVGVEVLRDVVAAVSGDRCRAGVLPVALLALGDEAQLDQLDGGAERERQPALADPLVGDGPARLRVGLRLRPDREDGDGGGAERRAARLAVEMGETGRGDVRRRSGVGEALADAGPALGGLGDDGRGGGFGRIRHGHPAPARQQVLAPLGRCDEPVLAHRLSTPS